jgi:hypothetical protein
VTSRCAREREGRSGNQPDDLLELSHRGCVLGVLSLGNGGLCRSADMRPDEDLPGAARVFAVQDDVKQICCGAARCTRNQLNDGTEFLSAHQQKTVCRRTRRALQGPHQRRYGTLSPSHASNCCSHTAMLTLQEAHHGWHVRRNRG